MSRPHSEDFLQSFRFRVADTEGFLEEVAGFNNVTTPELSVEAAEYREGNRKYTLKQPGVPSVEATTLQRGIAKTETTFYDWMMGALLGGGEYRTDLIINIYDQDSTGEIATDKASRYITAYEAFPTRVKMIGDLDATSSDINIQEIECACESVAMTVVP